MRIKLIISLLTLFIFLPSRDSPPKPTTPESSQPRPKILAKSFAFPIGETEFVSEAKNSKDGWYTAQDFGENNHLGEDWNANSGGDTDCGGPFYAVADGEITYAKNAGAGWGNVVIITHDLPNGKKVQTLYGHLDKILKSDGTVEKRTRIGTVGNANGKYLCHLHLEIRDENCLLWDKVFIGYSPFRKGWLDPSDFIDSQNSKR